MCSFVLIGVFVILLLLLLPHCIHESYVSMPAEWNKPIVEGDTSDCTKDPQKCCPAMLHYPPELCSGFQFTRPSNFNRTMTVGVSPATQSPPTLPSCKVNKMTPSELASLSVPHNVVFGTKSFDTMLGDEATVQMQKLCHISKRADDVQESVDRLEDTIVRDNAKAARNQSASQRLSGRDATQKNRAGRTWDAYCKDYTYTDPEINRQCDSLSSYARPADASAPDLLPTGA